MPDLSTLALYVMAATVVLVVPGPAVLYIVSQGVRQGSRAAITAVLGIHTGSLVQVAAATFGLSWLVLSSSVVFTVVKYLGAAYLIYLGIKALLSRAETAAPEQFTAKSARRLFGEGVLVNFLNPKLALFFLAFLPQFVDPGKGAVTLQIAVFGVVFVLLGLCTDGVYALLSGVIGPWLRGRSQGSRILSGERYVVGGTFIGLGVVAALAPSGGSEAGVTRGG